ncbi:hypothetical protein PLANPX_2420 [Lacipirellula parvula]|uniref:Uncharacterized protein n=1 Tax=Lacipirellula parvula TaxID=2650471 RepID=A0A5K7X8D1_9BACT|nr:hypothetical protein PLANPX_2420 [Lacipirellula parvula]
MQSAAVTKNTEEYDESVAAGFTGGDDSPGECTSVRTSLSGLE